MQCVRIKASSHQTDRLFETNQRKDTVREDCVLALFLFHFPKKFVLFLKARGKREEGGGPAKLDTSAFSLSLSLVCLPQYCIPTYLPT